ncbi:methylenetetrahydrofolate reductase [Corticibacterium sp. UT-5YL-CI-8]|nr:methylenetetrahydrofolate reductase [Tianweitania sp. UT-5YL-CI-8]
MGLFSFSRKPKASELEPEAFEFAENWSIEVMPRTAAKIDDFRALLPKGTRVYIAHIAGTPIEDMVATAKRLNEQGFPVMPHFPARCIADAAMLGDWIKRYREDADVKQALLLGGGSSTPEGELHSSIEMIETGLFDRHGFTHLHIAGHPEGNGDIDKDASTANVDAALLWKLDFSSRTDADMAITTQFAFDAAVVTDWAERIRDLGVTLPIHVGIAGPAKLQTLIKYAVSCGVGPSLKVLQKRALDVTRLLLPYEPTEVVAGLADYKARHPDSLIEQLHVFPLGGIQPAAEWMNAHTVADASVAAG